MRITEAMFCAEAFLDLSHALPVMTSLWHEPR
jgi:hypothetical protein